MTIVVADASPIRYLVLIGEAELLTRLFGQVLIPASVAAELDHARTPEAVRKWMSQLPVWIEVAECALRFPITVDLDTGERDAISLALERNADLVIMDDREGVDEALRQGLNVLGTLGVLDRAAARGLIDLPATLDRLRSTNFRASAALFELLVERHARRQSR